MKDKYKFSEYVECDCGDFDHLFRLTFWEDDPDYVYLSIHLRPHGFFKRLWNATRYVFGRRSRYGDYDEFLLNPADVERLNTALESFLACRRQQNENIKPVVE